MCLKYYNMQRTCYVDQTVRAGVCKEEYKNKLDLRQWINVLSNNGMSMS